MGGDRGGEPHSGAGRVKGTARMDRWLKERAAEWLVSADKAFSEASIGGLDHVVASQCLRTLTSLPLGGDIAFKASEAESAIRTCRGRCTQTDIASAYNQFYILVGLVRRAFAAS